MRQPHCCRPSSFQPLCAEGKRCQLEGRCCWCRWHLQACPGAAWPAACGVAKHVTWCRHRHHPVTKHELCRAGSISLAAYGRGAAHSSSRQFARLTLSQLHRHLEGEEPGRTDTPHSRQPARPVHLHGGGQLPFRCLQLQPAAVCQRIVVQAAQLLQRHLLQRGASSHHLERR